MNGWVKLPQRATRSAGLPPLYSLPVRTITIVDFKAVMGRLKEGALVVDLGGRERLKDFYQWAVRTDPWYVDGVRQVPSFKRLYTVHEGEIQEFFQVTLGEFGPDRKERDETLRVSGAEASHPHKEV